MILLVSQRCGFDVVTSFVDDRITVVAEIRDGKKKIFIKKPTNCIRLGFPI